MVINENGRRKMITKLEAAVTQLVNKAASGDGHAMRTCANSSYLPKNGPTSSEPTTEFSETDQKVLDNILKRFQQTLKGGKR